MGALHSATKADLSKKVVSLTSSPSVADASGGSAVARVAARLIAKSVPGTPLIVGVTGSVASGKTTFCADLAARLKHVRRIETVSTDGFLMSNAELASQGLSRRKGFPESYNASVMSGFLQRARWGLVEAPGYSHSRYDLDSGLNRTIDRPDILLVEGLGLSPDMRPCGSRPPLDALIYIDANEHDLETWFVERFIKLWRAAEADRASFYARFRTMTLSEVNAFARSVWANVNLPNLREHISLARDGADIVLRKAGDHGMSVTKLL